MFFWKVDTNIFALAISFHKFSIYSITLPTKNQRHIFRKLKTNEIPALGRAQKNLFLNFEHYDLAIHMVDVSQNR